MSQIIVKMSYYPSQLEAVCEIECRTRKSPATMTVKHHIVGDHASFEVTIYPDIQEEAAEAFKKLLDILEPRRGTHAYDGICLVFEEVFLAGIAFSKEHPDLVIP